MAILMASMAAGRRRAAAATESLPVEITIKRQTERGRAKRSNIRAYGDHSHSNHPKHTAQDV